MSENVMEVTDESFDEEVLNADTPVMVDMWAPWCGPCRMVSPILDELADDYEGEIKVAKLNVDDNRETAGQFGITSIPAVLFFNDGEELSDQRVIGARSKGDYEEVIQSLTE
ncbi:MAG: thioredoxin [Candidatus Brocadiia bacterium]